MWNRYIEGAKARGYAFEITIEHAWELFLAQDRRCALSGEPIAFGSLAPRAPNPPTASLDRIDPDVGYIAGNVQWVHKTINLMRNTLSIRDFVAWCHLIARSESIDAAST